VRVGLAEVFDDAAANPCWPGAVRPDTRLPVLAITGRNDACCGRENGGNDVE
jgi:hypothetical protein